MGAHCRRQGKTVGRLAVAVGCGAEWREVRRTGDRQRGCQTFGRSATPSARAACGAGAAVVFAEVAGGRQRGQPASGSSFIFLIFSTRVVRFICRSSAALALIPLV